MAKFKDTRDFIFTNLCDTYKRFEIPNFQRPYAWKNKQLQEFWDSLISNEKNYFLGNIVAVKQEIEESPLSIVDGQQRLTTIFLFLAALKEVYLSLKEEINTKENIEDLKTVDNAIAIINYRLFHIDPYNESHIRLILGRESYQTIFDAIIKRNKELMDTRVLDKQQARYLSNYKIAVKYIRDYSKHSELSKLSELKDKLLSLQFVVIVLESEVEIYNIFEGFNSTGLGLTPGDLIKNSILKSTNSDQNAQETAEYYWREMEELFEETDPGKITRFIRYYWTMHHGYISSGNLFQRIREYEIENREPSEIKNYVISLNEYAHIYLGLLYQRLENELKISKKLLEAFRKFQYINNEQVYMVLLSIYKKSKNGKILKESEWLSVLQNLWIFVVRARYSDISPSAYERTFAAMSLYITEEGDKRRLLTKLRTDFEELFSKVNSHEDFSKYFVQDVSYKSDRQLITQAITDLMHSDNKEISINSPEIEHIVPQNPAKWNLTAIEIDDYVHSLGNLTLLTSEDNGEKCKDNSFEIKTEVYSKSSFEINKEIVTKYGELFKTDFKLAIETRGEDLAEKISKMWVYKKL
ncbi:MAG: DUF262 domain-containing HNH endonuclease family protein [Candidatus Dojkabacteria bacterium]|jgi:uncharacterized protein with ParB-like and HNH nuclease domain|nr:DUF262 domain-containing HNH endonuclease family protein [Candidatus Dojkabacteria bacterium]